METKTYKLPNGVILYHQTYLLSKERFVFYTEKKPYTTNIIRLYKNRISHSKLIKDTFVGFKELFFGDDTDE